MRALDAVVIGISPDTVKSHTKFVDKLQIPFILLSDEEKNVSKLYDVVKEKKMFGKTVFGIERSTFVIDKEGNVVKEYRKVKPAGHAEEVLHFVQKNLV